MEKKPGRHAFVATDEQRAIVAQMVANGAGQEAICAAVGVSKPTLRKAFGPELRAKLGADNLFTAAERQLPPHQAPRRAKPARKVVGGRPRFKPDAQARERVAVLTAAGMAPSEVATALGVSEPTLRRHFAGELATGGAKKKAELIMAQWKAAMSGNVTAQRDLRAAIERRELNEAEGRYKAEAREAVEPKPSELGKKEQAQVDAAQAHLSSAWGELLSPTPRIQ